MSHHHGVGWILILAMGAAATLSANADSSSDQTAIRERLQRWAAAFNARDAAGVCDIFAPDLVYSIPQMIYGTRESICANLSQLFSNSGLRLHYDNPDIHEIVTSGEVALVRLTWTLTTEKGAERDITTEEGMDFFRRQPDGRWSIARFISFTARPCVKIFAAVDKSARNGTCLKQRSNSLIEVALECLNRSKAEFSLRKALMRVRRLTNISNFSCAFGIQ